MNELLWRTLLLHLPCHLRAQQQQQTPPRGTDRTQRTYEEQGRVGLADGA